MANPIGMDMNLAAERVFPTPLSSSALLPLLLLSLAKQRHTPEPSSNFRKEYDYIVVGGGTAGSVVASRLSEAPCVNVLLIEAGSTPPKLTEVPGIGRKFWFSNIDWNRKTAPQKYTGHGLVNRQVSWPSGKVLGGTSILSVGFHIVGNRKDYDNWAAMGAKGWSYNEVLPFFKKLEDNREHKYIANGFHGVGGPVTVMRPRYNPEIRGALFHAAKSIGYQIVDPNGRRQTGFFDPQSHLRDNLRCSTAKAYLVPAENRKNLDILTKAFVKKVIINKGRAVGVLFDLGGTPHQVRAKREVVLSAGAVNTAQILMLSGVGPREELHKFNIPVQADLPVGKNFQDHGCTTVDFLKSPHIPPFQAKLEDPESIKRFIHNRTGPLASTIGITNMAFLLNNQINPKIDYPNIELHYMEGSFLDSARERNLKPQVYNQVFGPYERHSKMGCLVSNNRPRSRGSVTLQSSNPYVPPVIDPNYFADPKDLEEVVEGMKVCKRIATSPVMKELGVQVFQTLYPGCEKYANNENAYFRCQAQSVVYTLGQPVGTAKMGDPRDPTTVVDSQLRVKNIHGLRVIDNSIMPTIISGNTELPAIMIGEKGSAIIKQSIECHNYNNAHYDVHGMGPSAAYPFQPMSYQSGSEYGDDSYSPYENDDDDRYQSNSYDMHNNHRNMYVLPIEENNYSSDMYGSYGSQEGYPMESNYQHNYQNSRQTNWPMAVFQERGNYNWNPATRGY